MILRLDGFTTKVAVLDLLLSTAVSVVYVYSIYGSPHSDKNRMSYA